MRRRFAWRNSPIPAPLMVDYLIQVAQSALTSHHQIVDGEAMDGPHGKLTIKKNGVHGEENSDPRTRP